MKKSLPIVHELIVVEGSHDVSAVKSTVKACILSVGGWGAKRPQVIEFLQKVEKIQKGIIFLLDCDETGTSIESFLLKQLQFPEKAITCLINEEKSLKKGKIGIEKAKSHEILQVLRKSGATFVEKEETPSLTRKDLKNLGLIEAQNSQFLRNFVSQKLSIPTGSTQNFLEKACFLNIQCSDIQQIFRDYSLK